MTTPAWALSLIYWLHMLATVAWIGALSTLAILVLPAARQALEAEAYAALLQKVRRRLDSLGWLCLVVLAGTGLFQMSANPNYQGFLSVSNRWALAILLKHLLFLAMAGVSAYLTWGLLPNLQRLALRLAQGQDVPGSQRLWRQEATLIRLNLVLGVFVLALTAVARAA
ncbi:MAG TPA: CopD family protein [Anaerolineales bacterium]|nr:CopD family protein [Anaerolineales bacterium]